MYVHTYMHSPHTTDRYWTSAKTLRRRLSSAPTICTPRSAVSILLAKKLSFLRVYADREPVSGLGFRVQGACVQFRERVLASWQSPLAKERVFSIGRVFSLGRGCWPLGKEARFSKSLRGQGKQKTVFLFSFTHQLCTEGCFQQAFFLKKLYTLLLSSHPLSHASLRGGHGSRFHNGSRYEKETYLSLTISDEETYRFLVNELNLYGFFFMLALFTKSLLPILGLCYLYQVSFTQFLSFT